MKKIGFFEKYNREAGVIESSSSRLLTIALVIFDMLFTYQYFITENNPVTASSILLVVVLFTAAFSPKALKDFTDLKDKIK